MKLSVYLIEDDADFARSVLRLLLDHPLFEVAGHAWSLAEARRFIDSQMPDIFLVDISLPDGNAMDLMREIRARSTDTKIMVLSTLGHEKYIMSSLEAGATGYLLKSEMPSQIIQSLIAVSNDGGALGQHASKVLIDRIAQRPAPQPSDAWETFSGSALVSVDELATRHAANEKRPPTGEGFLTPRECEIIQAVKRGGSSKEVARFFEISPFTVNQHLRSIYRKLGVNNKINAVEIARQHGIL